MKQKLTDSQIMDLYKIDKDYKGIIETIFELPEPELKGGVRMNDNLVVIGGYAIRCFPNDTRLRSNYNIITPLYDTVVEEVDYNDLELGGAYYTKDDYRFSESQDFKVMFIKVKQAEEDIEIKFSNDSISMSKTSYKYDKVYKICIQK